MRRIVFYSWQSDLPNACNRGLIQTALGEAAASIAADDTVAIEPVVDRDTAGVPGSPDIAATIFGKITGADIFVADVSIVGRAKGMRPTPNPNVLIELGYALKTLGHARVILVFNKAFGKIEELPFDLRARRALVYDMPEKATERAPERRKLQSQLEAALRSALAVIPEKLEATPAANLAVAAIEKAEGNRKITLRRALDELLNKIFVLEPKKPRDGGTPDELIEGISKTQEAVAEFSRIAEAAAVMGDADATAELYRWLGKIFERYDLPDGFSGRFTEADHDFFKFLGHEMLVTLVAFLMREQQWELLAKILNEPIPTRIRNRGMGNVGWEHASAHLPMLLGESRVRGRMSLHGDLLSKRHEDGGGLSAIMPMEDLMAADFFLFLLSQTLKNPPGHDMRYWRAWSCLYLHRAPMFIQNSESKQVAERVAKALGLTKVEDFKKLLAQRGPDLAKLFRGGGWWTYPVDQEDIDRVGTR